MLRFVSLLLLLLLPVGHASAAVMVLLQGYLGDDDPWRRSGAVTALVEHGWQDGGHLFATPGGVAGARAHATGSRRFYTVALPSDAPLMVQLRRLEPVMHYLQQRHYGESFYLVGHSAGGVLARLYMVQHRDSPVRTLITIASPHLGTSSAEVGLLAGESPLGLLAPLMGADELQRSRGLYYDLAREQAGNLLFWLNRQPHPPARYISVVRRGGGWFPLGDLLVPDWSQDMNNVIMLRGRCRTLVVEGAHGLSSADGLRLVDILRWMQRS